MEGQFAPCLLMYGVPVGSDLFVTKMLDNKVKEIEANTEKAIDLRSHEKQALWKSARILCPGLKLLMSEKNCGVKFSNSIELYRH